MSILERLSQTTRTSCGSTSAGTGKQTVRTARVRLRRVGEQAGCVRELPQSIAELLVLATKSLKLTENAQRAFLATGDEIGDIDEIQNDDLIYISTGSDFERPASGAVMERSADEGNRTLRKAFWLTITGQVIADFWSRNWNAEDLQNDVVSANASIALVSALFLSCVFGPLHESDIHSELSDGDATCKCHPHPTQPITPC